MQFVPVPLSTFQYTTNTAHRDLVILKYFCWSTPLIYGEASETAIGCMSSEHLSIERANLWIICIARIVHYYDKESPPYNGLS